MSCCKYSLKTLVDERDCRSPCLPVEEPTSEEISVDQVGHAVFPSDGTCNIRPFF